MARTASPEKVLDKLLQLPTCPPLVLIAAPDDVRRRRVCRAILDRFFTPKDKSGAAFPPDRVDAADLPQEKLDRLAEDLNSLSLFSPTRAILIDHLEKISAPTARKLAPLLEKVPSGTSLLLLGDKLPESGPLADVLKTAAELIVYPELKGESLANWLKRELQQAGVKKHTAGLIDLLISAAQGEPDQMVKMIEQLVLFSGGDEILDADFYQFYAETADPKDWELLDAIERRDFAKAEATLELLLAAGRSPLLLLATLQRNYSNHLAMLAMLREGRSERQIQESLNLKPWLFGKQLKAAKSQTLEGVRTKLSAILAADSMLKNRSLGADAVCSELIYQLAT